MGFSVEQEPFSALSGEYSRAARLFVAARLLPGPGANYDTAGDHFLCDAVGDPAYGSPDIPPISRVYPWGEVHYNSPIAIHNSYSPAGVLLAVRRAQGRLPLEHRLAGYWVTSADLQTGTTTEWRVDGMEEDPQNSLCQQLDLTADRLNGGLRFGSDVRAQLLLNARGSTRFVTAAYLSQRMRPIAQLMAEVDKLQTIVASLPPSTTVIDLATYKQQADVPPAEVPTTLAPAA
ncbi:MAG TPA: hypothetical protein VLE99_05115 [Candidatus Saccharimonadales bacterium]|nr:hypothetical protein [Candidatus Saccharimonadales bacterium]